VLVEPPKLMLIFRARSQRASSAPCTAVRAVLQTAIAIVGREEAEIGLHAGAPSLREILDTVRP
jgi:hypothetical protein